MGCKMEDLYRLSFLIVWLFTDYDSWSVLKQLYEFCHFNNKFKTHFKNSILNLHAVKNLFIMSKYHQIKKNYGIFSLNNSWSFVIQMLRMYNIDCLHILEIILILN